MLLAFVVVGFLFIKNNAIVSIVGCAGILGFLDDRFTFSPKLRLIIQIILITFLYLFYADAIATFYM